MRREQSYCSECQKNIDLTKKLLKIKAVISQDSKQSDLLQKYLVSNFRVVIQRVCAEMKLRKKFVLESI